MDVKHTRRQSFNHIEISSWRIKLLKEKKTRDYILIIINCNQNLIKYFIMSITITFILQTFLFYI